MSRKIYRWIFGTTLVIICIIFIFLAILSIDAANETDNWQFLNFDFTKRNNIISAYGGLLGAILSFITILFVILDLIYQRRQKTIEIEEKEDIRIQELKDSLSLVQVFIDRLHKNNIDQSKIARDYVQKEKTEPTEMNRMSFYPNTYPKLILEIDRKNIFKALQEFKPVDWQNTFIDIIKIPDFYDKSSEELSGKHQIHLNKKYKHSSEIGQKLDVLIDKVLDARNKFILENSLPKETLLENPMFIVLNTFKEATVKITKERKVKTEAGKKPDEISSSLMEFRKDIVSPLFDGIMELYRSKQEVPENIEEIHSLTQYFLRQTEKLIKDSNDYADHIEYYNKKYLSEESEFQKRLIEVSEKISKLA
jgi:hypothetical protein